MTTLQQRRRVRRHLGTHNSMPVEIVDGDLQPPRIVGKSYYWTTPSGKTIVRHPNAYGWKTRYWPSTRRIQVTRSWLFVAEVMEMGNQ